MTNGLAKQIEELNRELSLHLLQDITNAFEESIEDLRTKNIEEKSIQIGEQIPEFSLPNVFNRTIHSKEISGKIILAFYRGSWCPYCNLELNYLQNVLEKIKEKNTTLIAVSPQSQEHSLALAEANNLNFEVVTDVHNEYAKKLGIAFELQEFVLPYYQNLGIELSDFNNDQENTLPIPVVFVIDEKRKITFKFLDVNYMNRVDIDELINVL